MVEGVKLTVRSTSPADNAALIWTADMTVYVVVVEDSGVETLSRKMHLNQTI